MTLGQNSFNPSHSRPTLEDINRRRRELLAYQASRKAVQPAFQNQQQEQQEPEELPYTYPEDSYPNEDTEPTAALPWGSSALPPPALAVPALYGIAGRVVSSLAPHTEADPAAVLLQFLAAFGNLVGPTPHCRVGATRHGLNLFVVLVGESSKARKGTSWRQISSLLAEADPFWSAHRVTTARPTLTSILHALRDQQSVADCRLFLLSEEFASVLHTLGRETGQLSPLLRRAWDGGDLARPLRLISALWVTSQKLSSPTISATPNQPMVLPTAVSGPACVAANPYPTAAAFPPNNNPRWPLNSAVLSTGCTAKTKSFSLAPQPRERCGTFAMLP
jgi:hypothetical protein